MISAIQMPSVTTLYALMLALKAKQGELRKTASLNRRRELSADIGLIGEQLGSDVVTHIDMLVSRRRPMKLSLYDGRGCSKNGLTINTQLDQLIRLRGIAVCPFCAELLIGSDQGEVVATYA